MVEPDALNEAVGAWEKAAKALVARSPGIASLTSREFAQDPEGRPNALDDEIAELLRSSDFIVELLDEALQGDDADAVSQLHALVYGNLAAADALTVASDEPTYLSSSLRITSVNEFSTESWNSDIDFAVAGLRPSPLVAGAATAPIPPALSATIEELSDCAGSQLWNITTDTIAVLAFPNLGPTTAAVLAGNAGRLVRAASSYIEGVFAAVKRAASRVMAWVVDQANRVLPRQLDSRIANDVDDVVSSVKGNAISDLVGTCAAALLGLSHVNEAWENATQAEAATGLDGLGGAVRGPLRNLGTVEKCRNFINPWLRG